MQESYFYPRSTVNPAAVGWMPMAPRSQAALASNPLALQGNSGGAMAGFSAPTVAQFQTQQGAGSGYQFATSPVSIPIPASLQSPVVGTIKVTDPNTGEVTERPVEEKFLKLAQESKVDVSTLPCVNAQEYMTAEAKKVALKRKDDLAEHEKAMARSAKLDEKIRKAARTAAEDPNADSGESEG